MNRRQIVLVLIPLVLIGLGLAGRRADPLTAQPVVGGAAVDQAALMPVSPAPDALGSTFYCAGGTAADGGGFDSTIVIANPSTDAVSATVTVFPGALDGDANAIAAIAALQPVSTAVAVPAAGRAEVRLADIQKSPFAAALVEVDHGGAAVERRVSGASGVSTGPCASSPAPAWYLPTGVTAIDTHQLLALFNPFPDDTVLDIAFATSDGFRGPPPTQGYVVPARHVAVIDVATVAGRHDQVATQVVARRGQVVVDALQSFDGSAPAHPKGIAATLAAPVPAGVWTFAEGYVIDGLTETFTVFNPHTEAATVDLEITLDDPAVNGTVDPIVLTVPPFGYAQSSINAEARVPKAIGHSTVARVRAGPDVVAERTITATSPSPLSGLGMAVGSPLVSTEWTFADGAADATTQYVVALLNPSSTIVRASFGQLTGAAVAPIDGFQALEIAPGGRLLVDLATKVTNPRLSIVVTSSLPVAAERVLTAGKSRVLAVVPGIPSFDAIGEPPPPVATTTTTTTPSSVAPLPSS